MKVKVLLPFLVCFTAIARLHGWSVSRAVCQQQPRAILASKWKLTSRTSTTLQNSFGNKDDAFDAMDEAERMEMVRKIQNSFYSSSGVKSADGDESLSNSSGVNKDDATCVFVDETGQFKNLPLWRVGWIEVPGRANILNVHEGHYTHMFETILRRNDTLTNMYFGHLYLPGGTKNSRTGQRQYALKSWRDEAADTERYETLLERSAVIGCLMRITDYRRLQDGRLILFVQALERFVVESVVREFPYALADVQLLPDTEQTVRTRRHTDENFGKIARASAIKRAVQYYHDYEFARTQLPLPSDARYMDAGSISGAAMAKLLPFAEFNVDADLECTEHYEQEADPTNQDDNNEELDGFVGGTSLLEKQLEQLDILRDAPVSQGTDATALEKFVWLEIEELLRHTGFVLPREIRCLLPPDMDYLDIPASPAAGNQADSIYDSMSSLSPHYPGERRQSRLSYSLPAIWETPGEAIFMRQALLQIPSTTTRLSVVLEQLKAMNRKYSETLPSDSGEFE